MVLHAVVDWLVCCMSVCLSVRLPVCIHVRCVYIYIHKQRTLKGLGD